MTDKPNAPDTQITPDEARTQRVTLEHKIAEFRALRLPSDTARKRQAYEQAKSHLKQAHVEHVRRQIPQARLDKEIHRVEELLTEYERAVERQDVTATALTQEEKALQRHLMTHWGVFAADALKISAQADAARDKVNRALDAIRSHHARAQAAWEPLWRAANLNHGVPALNLQPVPAVSTRPPGVDADGQVIRGTDEFGRRIGDERQELRNEMTPERWESLRREQTDNAAKAPDATPVQPHMSEAERDRARALSPADRERLKTQTENERLQNIQATNEQEKRNREKVS
jgi:hypothetical protein